MNRICSSTYSRKTAMLGAQTLWLHLPERLLGPLSSALMMVSGASSQCILQWIERAYQSANEEAKRWVWNQPNPPEDPSGRFRLTVFSMDIVGTMMRAIARAHRRYGTTSCLPTLISDTRAKATRNCRRKIAGRHRRNPG